MTIKEIAKRAGVSIATVSKVVNGKDQNIHADTRERVLKIVRQYNYRPYSKVIDSNNARQFLIGLLLSNLSDYPDLVEAVVNTAEGRGYRVIVCNSKEDLNLEHENILQLTKHGIDSLIWLPVSEKSQDLRSEIKKEITVTYLDDKKRLSHMYSQTAEMACESLIHFGHKQIAIVTDESADAYLEDYLAGYKRAHYDLDIPLPETYLYRIIEDTIKRELLFSEYSAIICLSSKSATLLLKEIWQRKLHVPNDLSLITISTRQSDENDFVFSSVYRVPLSEYGQWLCEQAIDRSESKAVQKKAPAITPTFRDRNSVSRPIKLLENKVVVVGNINLDIVLHVSDIPGKGKTVLVHRGVTYPGGKGGNQAAGVAKLGGNSILIGKIGHDLDGQNIMQYLNACHVNTSYIIQDKESESGKAYIYVQEDSESSIAILPGANANLTADEISERSDCFSDARCCLIQTEISVEAGMEAARISRRVGARTIVKPSALELVSDEFLQMIDVFVPNLKESEILAPSGCRTLKERSDYFRSKGVDTVIITAGSQGCYVFTDEIDSLHVPAIETEAVDATGAADAFIAALSMAFVANKGIVEAVHYANTAAGLSVTKEGAMPSLPILEELNEAYIKYTKTDDE